MLDKLEHRARDTGCLRCYLCGDPIPEGDLHLDHVLPLIAGGRHTLDNLEPAHGRCNLIKGDTHLYDPPLDEFVPLLDRLRREPPEALWRDRPDLARKVLVAPRAVPVDDTIGDFRKRSSLVRVLAGQADPYRAMSLGEIERAASLYGLRLGKGEVDRNWLKLFGLSKVHGNRPVNERADHDRRLPPDPLVVATRVRDRPGQWGVRGFRLRFRIDPLVAAEDIVTEIRQPVDVPYPDHDEVVPPRSDDSNLA